MKLEEVVKPEKGGEKMAVPREVKVKIAQIQFSQFIGQNIKIPFTFVALVVYNAKSINLFRR